MWAAGLALSSNEPETLEFTWNAANPEPDDYQIVWAKTDEEFPSHTEEEGTAFATGTYYTISGLEGGADYKVRVQARYFDGNGLLQGLGPWSETVHQKVAGKQDASDQDPEGVTANALKGLNEQKLVPRQNPVGPTVTIAGADGVVVEDGENLVKGGSFDVTVTFSSDIGTSFDHTDITLTNAGGATAADVMTATAGTVYTVTVRPTAGFDGTLTVQVPAGAAQDASNQDNQASNVFTATVTVQSACVTGGAVPAGDQYADLARDCEILLGLHDTLVGTTTLSPAWSVNTNINNWQGVGVEADRVYRVAPAALALNGTVPAELGSLSALTELDLSDNQLTGGIPTQLGSLTELKRLFLDANQLSGSIPGELGSLSKLVELSLDSNDLTGNIPTTLGNLSALEALSMSYNEFDAQIPSEITQLSSLEILEMIEAQLTGPVVDLSVMTSLKYVDLTKNQLTGTISSLTNLTGLIRLNLSENQIGGPLPSVAGLASLDTFTAQYNQFTGELPDALTQLGALRQLSLTGNKLTGSIPDFSNMSKLEWLQLDRNQLDGTMPSLSNLPELQRLLVHRNRLTGTFPTLTNVPKLLQAYFHCNRFSGSVPASLNDITTLQQLLLFDNQLTGVLPDLSALTSLSWLWLNHNHLEGDFSDPAAIAARLPQSVWLTLNANLFEGVDPETGAIDTLPDGVSWTVNSRDPCSPRASFADSALSVSEGSSVTVTLELEVAVEESTTIPIAVTHNGGATAADYSGLPASVTFNSGEDSKSFTLTATDDSDDDDDESLTLRFGTLPTGVNPGRPITTTINLQDNDVSAVTVTIAGADGVVVEDGENLVKGGSFDVTVTFSSDIGTSFDHTDVTLTNAQAATAADVMTATAGTVYTVTVRPTAGFDGTLTVQVPAGAAQDASNQDNQASNVFTATVTVQSACVTGGAVPAGDEYAGLARDCEILLGLHDTLVGTATLTPAWSVNTDINSWDGIVVSQNRVYAVNLDYKSLSGSVPPELGQLSALVNLNLSGNDLSGSIPSELGDLENMESLSLDDTGLTGMIPTTLGKLKKLYFLHLGLNELSGSIPTELGNMDALESLLLQNNELTGEIPSGLTQLSALKSLHLNSNRLTGTVPDWSGMSDLEIVQLDRNQLTGMSGSLTNLPNLNSLLVHRNKLAGQIPTITDAPKLWRAWFHCNKLSGEIPTSLNGLLGLRQLYLYDNQLRGEIPDLSSPIGLEQLYLSHNHLEGDFSDTALLLAKLPMTATLQLSLNGNLFTGVDRDSGAIDGLPSRVTVAAPRAPCQPRASFDAATFSVTEGSTVTVTVKLEVAVAETTTIPISVTHNGGASAADYSGLPSSLTFNIGESSKPFTITATDDSDNDDGESLTLRFDTLPSDVNPGSPMTTTVSLVDSDEAVVQPQTQVRASFGATSYTALEGGSAVTVTVELDADPERTVTIPISVTLNGGASVDDYSGLPSSVTFDSGDTSEPFTITATDDSDDDDGESLTLRFGTLPTSVSAGTPAMAIVSLQDNDVPAVEVSYEQASYTVGEGGSVVITVTLSAAPERSVTIPISRTNQGGAVDADYSGVPASVTFNSTETEKTFTFSATQDSDDDDGESVKLGFDTLPTGVSEGSPSETTVSITDDDVPAVTVRYEQSSYTVGENSSVTVKVILSADPERSVTIPISRTNQGGAADADYSGVPASVSFGSTETEKSFTFSATQDSDDDDGESVKLGFDTLPTGVSEGSPSETTVSITDDDVPAVTVRYEQSSYTVSEGNSVVVTVTLSADPERSVTIPISRTNQGGAADADYSGVPASVTFSSTETEKTFTFSATQDTDDDDGESVKLGFGTLPTGVSEGSPSETTVSITDDDVPAVTVRYEQSSYTVGENSSVTVKVLLSAAPERSVTIPISRTNQGGAADADYSGVPASVTFGSSETEKSFSFSATQDTDDDDGESVKLGFDTLPTGVSEGSPNETTVSITDDDVPAVTVRYEQSSYTVAENSSVTVKVILSADPERSVTIPISRTNQGGAVDADYSGVPASVTFSSTETEKTFTFSATQDTDDDDGESVKLGFGTLPTGVSEGSPSETTVSITDDDVPAVTVRYEQSSYTVGENSSVTVKVLLSAAPERSVTIPISRTNQGGAADADYSGVPASVTFNSTETEKTFTFSATQDSDDDDGESVKLGFGTLPTGVSEGSPNETTVSITDDDVPAVTVRYEQSSYTVGENSSVTVKVLLSAAPERSVTIPISRTNQGGAADADYSGVPASVSFGSSETEKTFTFSATQDSDDDDGESVKLGFGSLPTGVSEGSPNETTVSITDDDVPAVTVRYEQSSYTVAENSSVTVKVILSAAPERNVTIPISRTNQGGAADADYSGVPASVTFGSSETEKTFTFSATQDSDDDDGESVKLGFGTLPTGVSQGSPNETTVSITDDDVAAVTVRYEQSSYTVPEGSTVVVTVTLSADPERNVTIPISRTNRGGAVDADYSGVPASVSFGSSETEKTFTFSATQDSDDDDGESVKLGFGTLPTGVSEGSPSETTVSITDDDVPAVTVRYEQSSYTVGENSSVTVKVLLSAAPERSVTIPISRTNQGGAVDADYSGVPASVSFGSSETEKTFTFSATQDSDDDDGESVKLGFGSLPTGVSEGSPSETTVSITDDDVAAVTVSYGAAAYSVTEGGSAATVTVELSADPERTITIPISVMHNGGATSADYSGVPSSVTFTSGDTSESFVVMATDDSVDDDGESLTLDFGSLPTGVSEGSPASAIISILDNDSSPDDEERQDRVPSRQPSIQPIVNPTPIDDGLTMVAVSFNMESYTAWEGGNPASVAVELDTDPRRLVTIPLNVTFVNGTSGDDFSGVPDTVTFDKGEMSKTFALMAVDDSEDDDDECIILTFGELPYGVISGLPDTATGFLMDNDVPRVAVSYGAEYYAAAEGGHTAIVTVALDADPKRVVTLPISVTHKGGATAADYSGVPASVTFSDGDRFESFGVTAIKDNEDEGDESIVLSFGPLSAGMFAGTPASTTVNLLDDVPISMLISASLSARTYLSQGGSSSATVTVMQDVGPSDFPPQDLIAGRYYE